MDQELMNELELLSGWDIPACDVLSWMLVKMEDCEVGSDTDNSKDGLFYAKGRNNLEFAETPEDAAGKLLLRLLKEKVIPL
jgi:hypothetical protein